MFAVLAIALCLGAAAILLWPILRPGADRVGAVASLIYEDQLAEVEREADRGLLGPAEAAAARAEVERRLLTAARAERAEAGGRSRAGRLALAAFAASVPVLGGLAYLATGNPDLASAPSGGRAAPAPPSADAPTVATLTERLRAAPEDADAWAQLARLLARQGRPADALPAYAEAIRLTDGRDLLLLGEQAEQTVIAASNRVTPEARALFERVLAAQPGDARATTYLAIADAQDGDLAAATARLRALLATAPPDAPWRPRVEELLARLEADAAQAARIEGMVEGLAARLAEAPDDAEGWRRLARSYDVLGRTEDAAAAWAEVLRLVPGDEEATAALAAPPLSEDAATPSPSEGAATPRGAAPAAPRSTPAPR